MVPKTFYFCVLLVWHNGNTLYLLLTILSICYGRWNRDNTSSLLWMLVLYLELNLPLEESLFWCLNFEFLIISNLVLRSGQFFFVYIYLFLSWEGRYFCSSYEDEFECFELFVYYQFIVIGLGIGSGRGNSTPNRGWG